MFKYTVFYDGGFESINADSQEEAIDTFEAVNGEAVLGVTLVG